MNKNDIANINSLLLVKNYDDAIVLVNSLLTRSNNQSKLERLYLLLGDIYFVRGDLESSFNNYFTVSTMNSKNRDAKLGLGRIYKAQGSYFKAEVQFRSIKNLNSQVRLELGHLYHLIGEKEAALEQYSYLEAFQRLLKVDDRIIENHITKHGDSEFCGNKDIHGIFCFIPSLASLFKLLTVYDVLKKPGYICDIYNIPYDNCGYYYDQKGNLIILNYLTILTQPFSHRIITAYPSFESSPQKVCTLERIRLK